MRFSGQFRNGGGFAPPAIRKQIGAEIVHLGGQRRLDLGLAHAVPNEENGGFGFLGKSELGGARGRRQIVHIHPRVQFFRAHIAVDQRAGGAGQHIGIAVADDLVAVLLQDIFVAFKFQVLYGVALGAAGVPHEDFIFALLIGFGPQRQDHAHVFVQEIPQIHRGVIDHQSGALGINNAVRGKRHARNGHIQIKIMMPAQRGLAGVIFHPGIDQIHIIGDKMHHRLHGGGGRAADKHHLIAVAGQEIVLFPQRSNRLFAGGALGVPYQDLFGRAVFGFFTCKIVILHRQKHAGGFLDGVPQPDGRFFFGSIILAGGFIVINDFVLGKPVRHNRRNCLLLRILLRGTGRKQRQNKEKRQQETKNSLGHKRSSDAIE